MSAERVCSNHILFFDHQNDLGYHRFIGQTVCGKVQNRAVLTISGIVTKVKSDGIGILRPTLVTVFARFEHPAVICAIGTEELHSLW